jgi:hypothetical protein
MPTFFPQHDVHVLGATIFSCICGGSRLEPTHMTVETKRLPRHSVALTLMAGWARPSRHQVLSPHNNRYFSCSLSCTSIFIPIL